MTADGLDKIGYEWPGWSKNKKGRAVSSGPFARLASLL
jgi:hypothetical protein